MQTYLKANYQFLILCGLWVATGMLAGTIPAMGLVVLSAFLLRQKLLFQELLFGFALILILSDSRQPGLSFAGDVKVLYILLLSLFLIGGRKIFLPNTKLLYLFAPFLLLALIVVFLNENWLTSFQKTLSYILLLFIVPNYFIMGYKEWGLTFLKNIVFFLSLFLVAGLILRLMGSDVAHFAGRYRGVFGNANGIGLFCILFFLLFFVIQEYFPTLFSVGEKRYLYATIVLSILLSGSRTTIVSILCFLVFFRLYKLSPYLGFIVLLIFMTGYELLFQNFESIIRAVGLGDYFRVKTLETGSGRSVAWEFAWENIADNFYFGKGFAHDEAVFQDPRNAAELSIKGHQGNVHNSYLTIWMNTGVVGLFFFFRGLFLAFFKGAKNSRVAFPVMFTVLFSANFESWMAASLNPVTIQLWIILTLLTSPEFNEERNQDTLPLH